MDLSYNLEVMKDLPVKVIGNILSRLKLHEILFLHPLLAGNGKLKKISLKGNSLVKLRLVDCSIPTLKLKVQQKLRILILDDVSSRLKVRNNAEDIEIVDVLNFTTSRFYFYDMIAELSKARRMSLCDVMFEDDNNEIVNGKNESVSFPQLTHLT